MTTETDLATHGAARLKARAQAKKASTLLAAAVRQAHADGMPIAEIARRAQLTRPAIYTMLQNEKKPPPP